MLVDFYQYREGRHVRPFFFYQTLADRVITSSKQINGLAIIPLMAHRQQAFKAQRTGGRVVEGTGLENQRA